MKRINLLLCLLTVTFLFASCEEEPTPVASFTFSGADKSAPAEVSFTNNSLSATTYLWEFGDGASSTEKNTKHTYSTGGTFTVKLTAYSGKASNSKTSSLTILAPIPNPVANFSFLETGNFAPSGVTFTNSSTNASTYYWDFGDGQTSTLQSPTHIFTKGGIFNATLKVKNSVGIENIINKTLTIKNNPTKLKINSIVLTGYPATMPSGGGWDSSDGPDIYPSIISSAGTYNHKDYRKQDFIKSYLPYTFSSGFPLTFTALDFKNTIEFYDYDPIGNEWMGGYYFTVRNSMPMDGTKYPATVDFQSSTSELKFTLNVEWMQ